MNAYTLAAELLGDVELSTGQLAELRAIDMKHQQRLFTLLHRSGAGAGAAGPADADESSPAAAREPTEQEMAALRETIVSDLLAMLTPEQRDELRGR